MNLKNLIKGEITQNDFFNYHNIVLMYYDLPCNIKGFVFSYDNIYFIIINNLLDYCYKKMTLLHEIAHIELNHLRQANKDLLAFYICKYEDEADRYINFLIED